jgi:hypothetical protein
MLPVEDGKFLNYHGITVDVAGFSDALESLKNVDIVTGYTAYDDPSTGKTYILHIGKHFGWATIMTNRYLSQPTTRANGFQVTFHYAIPAERVPMVFTILKQR